MISPGKYFCQLLRFGTFMMLKYIPQESTGLIQHKAFFQIGNLLTIR